MYYLQLSSNSSTKSLTNPWSGSHLQMENSFSPITSVHFELFLQRDICTFAENTFGNLCNESFLLLSSVTEVTSEVFNLKGETWLHKYS